MKSAEARDQMVARVKATFDKYPSFLSLPAYHGKETAGSATKSVVLTSADQGHYIQALHTLCADCEEVLGRFEDRIVGK
jgi:hypothetical protein